MDLLFQNWRKNFWQILNRVLESQKNLQFNGLLLKRVYNVWAKKVQRNYDSRNWRVMQNLKRNRLVVSKLKGGIWQILTQELKSLKNSQLSGLLLKTVFYVLVKKYRGVIFHDTEEMLQNLNRNELAVSKLT